MSKPSSLQHTLLLLPDDIARELEAIALDRGIDPGQAGVDLLRQAIAGVRLGQSLVNGIRRVLPGAQPELPSVSTLPDALRAQANAAMRRRDGSA